MQSHRRLILGSDMGKYTNMLAEINNSIISFLDEKIVPNIDLPESLICGDGMMNARALVDTVCNIIANYRNSKTKTKSLRQQWKDMKALMESMVLSKGIKFAKYLVLSKGIVSPYTYPDKGYELNMDFENLLEEYSRTLGLYKSEKHYITNSRQYALQMLSTVLDVAENHANKPRTGRFFKRWNDLNTDQKQERVKEYLDYLASTNDFRPEWVMEKTSRIKDVGLDQISVKWSQKLGFINSIPGLSLEEETDKFRTKTKKKVKWGDQNTIDQKTLKCRHGEFH
ncbi:hypothetical protein GGF31_003458 [Allomyces arbusculus]|nr:hypothetical protein GGF31_003458 [Allomyces arbusculus]